MKTVFTYRPKNRKATFEDEEFKVSGGVDCQAPDIFSYLDDEK